MNLNNLGLTLLTSSEIAELDGGGFWSKLIAAVSSGPVGAAFAIAAVADAAYDIGSGFARGVEAGIK